MSINCTSDPFPSNMSFTQNKLVVIGVPKHSELDLNDYVI